MSVRPSAPRGREVPCPGSRIDSISTPSLSTNAPARARRARALAPLGGLVALLLFVLACALAAPLAFAHADPASRGAMGDDADARRHLVRVERSAALDALIAREELDVTGPSPDRAGLELFVSDAELALLVDAGFAPRILETREGPRPLGAGEGADEPGIDGPLNDPAYHDPAEMQAFLEQTAADHPAITRLETIGTSHEGRPILAMLISDNAAIDEDEPAVILHAQAHAREVMTGELGIDIIKELTDKYGVDPKITERVDELAIWVVPLVNPDGVARVHEVDDFWRKNNRDNDGNGVIGSGDGVDLNRNFEWGWGGWCNGSSGSPGSSTYRGPREASEPETEAMLSLSRRAWPVFLVDYHSYGEEVLYALSCDPDYSPRLSTVSGDGSISRVIGEGFAANIVQADGEQGYAVSPSLYGVDGTARDQHYHETGAISFVVEINSSSEGGFHPDHATWAQPTVEGHRPGWGWLLDRVFGSGIGGNVVDATSGEPLVADIALDELALPDGKRLTSEAGFGRFHLVTVPGLYTLRVSAEGYEDFTQQVDVADALVDVQVALEPKGSRVLVAEDFEDPSVATEWIVGAPDDSANDGFWTWGEPEGTRSGFASDGSLRRGNPLIDATPGPGRHAFVTGNAVAAGFDEDDVDLGYTTLNSPSWDLSGHYAVTASFMSWFVKELNDPIDRFVVEVSVDEGASWLPLLERTEPTLNDELAEAWRQESVRLDDVVAPAATTRLRFRALDSGTANVVEAGLDELFLRGYRLDVEGRVRGVRLEDPAATIVRWEAVPGGEGALYDVERGDLASLGASGGAVQLGTLACIEAASVDLSTEGNEDSETPAPGGGFFYLVRFTLGESAGDLGASSAGEPRSGEGGCGAP